MTKSKTSLTGMHPETRLVAAGRDYTEHGFVNPGVFHVSTVTFPSVAALHERQQPYTYGRRGTPTSRAIETAIADLEGGHDARVCPSGLAACTTVLLAYLKAGDHLLMTDSVYNPVRHFCDTELIRFGIETEYYDPLAGAGIDRLIRPNTGLVYTESPGSQTMEMQDIAAIAAAATARGVLTAADNTWSAGHYFKPLRHGCAVSIQAVTKYIAGHSDTMMGAITTTAAAWPRLRDAFIAFGQYAGPDDMMMALRGLRTLDVRLQRHMQNAVAVAGWLQRRPEVAQVLYPALPGAPGHELWKRDFTGASGLFSVILKPVSEPQTAAMLDGLQLFGMGYSWGGHESLAVPFHPVRTAQSWSAAGRRSASTSALKTPPISSPICKPGLRG